MALVGPPVVQLVITLFKVNPIILTWAWILLEDNTRGLSTLAVNSAQSTLL